MRGPSKSPPKYRKHKRSGQAVVTLGGKDFYLGPYGSKASLAEYDRLTAEWLANGRTCPSAKTVLTISELCAVYWRYAKAYYVKNGKPTDELGCIRMALRHTRRLYGRLPVTDFGPIALKPVRTEMIERGNSRKYVNSNVNRIRRMFKWGVANELVEGAVYQALKAVDGLGQGKSDAKEPAPIEPVDDSIVDATLKHCSQTVADKRSIADRRNQNQSCTIWCVRSPRRCLALSCGRGQTGCSSWLCVDAMIRPHF